MKQLRMTIAVAAVSLALPASTMAETQSASRADGTATTSPKKRCKAKDKRAMKKCRLQNRMSRRDRGR